MNTCKAPLIIPKGWEKYNLPNGSSSIVKETISGLCALLTIDQYDETCSDFPPMGIGEYFHISLSRRDKYPQWDEMKEFIYGECPFFNEQKDVVMLLPPKNQYVNVHSNCFHFYQKIS